MEKTDMKKFCILILLSILSYPLSIVYAQQIAEFDINYGFGTSELLYNSVPGITVSIYPIKNFGFSAGLQYSWRWQTKTSSLSGTNPITADNEGDSLIFSYAASKYKEQFSGRILQIPLLLKYSNKSYFIAGGLKIASVQDIRVKISYEGLQTEGYYPEYNLTLAGPNAPLSQGFGEFKDSSFKTKLSSSKTLMMLALEGGIKFKLNNNFSLDLGTFIDYSLNKGFSRTSLPIVERVQNEIDAWRPWSAGAIVKLSLSFEHQPPQPEEYLPDEPPIQAQAQAKPSQPPPSPPPPPVAIAEAHIPKPLPVALPAVQGDSFQVLELPDFLLNRKADFEFNYPENHTSQSDSLHLALTAQIADTLRAAPKAQLHCVGHSEKLISESVAYETAIQRSLRIRNTLIRFYGISENRIFIYSQGSETGGYKRAECFVIDS